MLRTLIWPLAFAAMDDAGAAAFGAWPHVKSVSDVAATAIVTDHGLASEFRLSWRLRAYHDGTPPQRATPAAEAIAGIIVVIVGTALSVTGALMAR
jgi:hypothetical protein